MRKWESEIHLLIVAWIATWLGGCKAPFTQPKFMSPAFNISEIDIVYVMPPLEFSSQSMKLLDQDIWKAAKIRLREKGYRFICLQDKSLVYDIKREEFSKPNSTVFANIGPPEARWLLFFVWYENLELTGFTMKNGQIARREYTPAFELSAYLFDRSKGELIWSNSTRMGRRLPIDAIFFATIQNIDGLPNKNE